MAKESFWKLFTLGRMEAVTLAAGGKPLVVAGAETVAGGGGHGGLMSLLSGFGTSMGGTLTGSVILGGFGVVSAVTNHVEYLHERAEIGHFYHEEIAAQNKKHSHYISDHDLSNVENGNAAAGVKQNTVIHEAIGRERSHRNLGVAASFVASIAVFTLMAFVGAHAPIGLSVEFGAQVIVGVLSYLAIKKPLEKIGAAMLGLNKETTHERILEMTHDRSQGKSITREQLVEVFVSANRQLQDYVERSFGRTYEELSLADKVRVAETLAEILPLDKIAANINAGTVKASELAFTVEGEVSGVLPKSPEEAVAPSMFQRFAQHCKGMVHSMGGMFHAEKAHTIDQLAAVNKTQHDKHAHAAPKEESPIVEFNEGPSFVERVGGPKHDYSKGYRDNIEAQRNEQVHLAGTQTMQ